MSRWSPVRPALPVLALLVAVCLLAGVATTATATADGFEEGETAFVVELDTDGDGHWQITETFDLADDDEHAAFETLADEFEAGAFDLASVDAIEQAAAAVDASTDRSMAVTDRERTSAVEGTGENRTGTLTVSFTWENFARMDGDDERLHVDDVLESDQGLWLPGLTADQELVVRSPDGYAVLDAAVPPQNGQLRWEGPVDFDRETLAATFAGDGTGGDGDGNGNATDGGPNGDSIGLAGALLVVLAVVAIAAVLVGFRDRIRTLFGGGSPASGPPNSEAENSDASRAPETDGDRRADDEPAPDAEAETDDGTPAAGAGGASEDGDDGDDSEDGDDIDEELLSDEERVERLLERNGGRMKQAQIVDETGWSNAKVSQLLSSMDEDGRIDKLRIGRENLISFPDVDVTDSESP